MNNQNSKKGSKSPPPVLEAMLDTLFVRNAINYALFTPNVSSIARIIPRTLRIFPVLLCDAHHHTERERYEAHAMKNKK